MAGEKPKDHLFDFLYKDSSRLFSYYSQIFSGRLAQVETSTSIAETREKGLSLSLPPIVTVPLGKSDATTEAKREVYDPHDLIALDVLSHLQEGGYISADTAKARNGQLVVISGTLFLVDMRVIRGLLENADLFAKVVPQSFAGATTSQGKKQVSGILKLAGKVIASSGFESAFILRTSDNTVAGGTVHERYLEEPIASVYARHGGGGLPGMTVVAIKEQPDVVASETITPVSASVPALAGALRDLVFPKPCYQLTPLVIFRQLTPIPKA